MKSSANTFSTRTTQLGLLGLIGLCLAANAARADESACFPLCEQTQATTTTCALGADSNGNMQQAINQVESINEKVKPLKEVVGYIRSPQGLAVKLVNDHVIKIPAWVGYALDPVGAFKNKAIGEVRDRAKTALKTAVACKPADGAVLETPVEMKAEVNVEVMKDPAHRA